MNAESTTQQQFVLNEKANNNAHPKELSNALNNLIKPEEDYSPAPYKLTNSKKKKRRLTI